MKEKGVEFEPVAGFRKPSQLMDYQAADRFVGALGKGKFEEVLNLFNVYFGVGDYAVVVNDFPVRFLLVVFICYLADDFFQDVFQGHQAPGDAELVSDNSHMDLLGLKDLEQIDDFFRLQTEEGRVADLARLGRVGCNGIIQNVLGVDNADNMVRALGVDRDSGIAVFGDQGDYLADCGLGRSADHLVSRGHYLPGQGLFQFEDTADHQAFLRGDQALFFSFFKKFLDFVFEFFGRVRCPGKT